MSWGDGLDSGHVPTTLRLFWDHARITAHVRPRSKKLIKTLKLKIL